MFDQPFERNKAITGPVENPINIHKFAACRGENTGINRLSRLDGNAAKIQALHQKNF